MPLSLEVIDALVEAGCTARQLAAAVRADRERGQRLRAERLARRPTESTLTESGGESASVPVVESGAAAIVSAGGTLKAVARTGLLGASSHRLGARMVAAFLVESCNLKTGRCDPGVGLIARKTGLSGRSVRRSLGELERAGLVRRVIHGGARGANAYLPNWQALEQLGATAGNGFGRTAAAPDADSVSIRTQLAESADRRVRQNKGMKLDSAVVPRARPPNPAQREFLLPLPGKAIAALGKKGDPAFGHAASRLWRDMRQHFPGEALTGATMRIAELGLEDRAIEAEMKQAGSGVFFILTRLYRDLHGPPRAVGQGG